MDAFLDNQSGRSTTELSVGQRAKVVGQVSSLINVTVVEYNHGTFATKLQGKSLHGLA
jgi:hypothetical protein